MRRVPFGCWKSESYLGSNYRLASAPAALLYPSAHSTHSHSGRSPPLILPPSSFRLHPSSFRRPSASPVTNPGTAPVTHRPMPPERTRNRERAKNAKNRSTRRGAKSRERVQPRRRARNAEIGAAQGTLNHERTTTRERRNPAFILPKPGSFRYRGPKGCETANWCKSPRRKVAQPPSWLTRLHEPCHTGIQIPMFGLPVILNHILSRVGFILDHFPVLPLSFVEVWRNSVLCNAILPG